MILELKAGNDGVIFLDTTKKHHRILIAELVDEANGQITDAVDTLDQMRAEENFTHGRIFADRLAQRLAFASWLRSTGIDLMTAEDIRLGNDPMFRKPAETA